MIEITVVRAPQPPVKEVALTLSPMEMESLHGFIRSLNHSVVLEVVARDVKSNPHGLDGVWGVLSGLHEAAKKLIDPNTGKLR